MIRKYRQIDYFFLCVVIAYAFDFGNIKYALAGLFALIYLFLGNHRRIILKGNKAGKGLVDIICGILILLAITFFLQILYGFNSYAINEAIYFLTPVVFVWVYISRSSNADVDRAIDWFLLTYTISFLYQYIPKLTIENILAISFINSYSPFESEFAFIFLILEAHYLAKKQNTKAIWPLVLCILSMKRICLIVSVLLYVTRKWFANDKRISKEGFLVSVALFVGIPIVMCYLVDNNISDWLYYQYGIDLNIISLTRSERLELVLDAGIVNRGLGSITPFVTNTMNDIYGSKHVNRSLHNDLARIYLECGLVGSIVFTWSYLKAVRFSRPVFLVMCYIFLECCFNHLFGAGTADMWMVMYLFVAYTAGKSNGREAV